MESILTREEKLVAWIVEAARALAATALLDGSVPERCPETTELERRLRIVLQPGEGNDTCLLNYLAGDGMGDILPINPETLGDRAYIIYHNHRGTEPGGDRETDYQSGAEYMLAREEALRELAAEGYDYVVQHRKASLEALRDPHIGDEWMDEADGSIIRIQSIAKVEDESELLTLRTRRGDTSSVAYMTISRSGFPTWVQVCGLTLVTRKHTELEGTSF